MFEVIKIKTYSKPIFYKRLIRLSLGTQKTARAFLAASFAKIVLSEIVFLIMLAKIKRLDFGLLELFELSGIKSLLFSLGLEAFKS